MMQEQNAADIAEVLATPLERPAADDDDAAPYPDDLARACVATARELYPHMPGNTHVHLNGHIALLKGLIGAPRYATRTTWIAMLRDARQTVTHYVDQQEDSPRIAVENHIRRLKLAIDLS